MKQSQDPQSNFSKDKVVEEVVADLRIRSYKGIIEYKTTLHDDNETSLRDWLQHAYEETLDNANYLKKAIMKMDAENNRIKNN